MFVCMYVLYAFRHRRSQCNQTLHGTPLGPGEGQDGIGGTERGMGKSSPQFFKNGEKIFGFLKNVENVLQFLRYLHLAFIYSHCPV